MLDDGESVTIPLRNPVRSPCARRRCGGWWRPEEPVLSVITGSGKWVGSRPMPTLYQQLIVAAGRKFWRCVENGEPPCPVPGRAAEAASRGTPLRRKRPRGGRPRSIRP